MRGPEFDSSTQKKKKKAAIDDIWMNVYVCVLKKLYFQNQGRLDLVQRLGFVKFVNLSYVFCILLNDCERL